MVILRFCSVCGEYLNINLDKFLASGKKQVVCGNCVETVLLTKQEAYDILYNVW